MRLKENKRLFIARNEFDEIRIVACQAASWLQTTFQEASLPDSEEPKPATGS